MPCHSLETLSPSPSHSSSSGQTRVCDHGIVSSSLSWTRFRFAVSNALGTSIDSRGAVFSFHRLFFYHITSTRRRSCHLLSHSAARTSPFFSKRRRLQAPSSLRSSHGSSRQPRCHGPPIHAFWCSVVSFCRCSRLLLTRLLSATVHTSLGASVPDSLPG